MPLRFLAIVETSLVLPIFKSATIFSGLACANLLVLGNLIKLLRVQMGCIQAVAKSSSSSECSGSYIICIFHGDVLIFSTSTNFLQLRVFCTANQDV